MNQYIDHTLLKPDATSEDIRTLCKEAMQYQFASVCIQPIWVKLASDILKGSNVKVCTVVGFPLGANTKEMKAEEAYQLVTSGAQEIDMVISLGYLKAKQYQKVKEEIEAVVQASKPAIVKVIIETCLLTDEEKQIASELTKEAGAHFVKTSTGFSRAGATLEDVALMRKAVGLDFGVKASGGIRDLASAKAMIKAGATRLGTSSGVAIMQSYKIES